MPERRIKILLGACALVVVFTVQHLSEAGGPDGAPRSSAAERRPNLTEAEKQREAAKREAVRRLELEREYKESKKATERLAERAKTQRQEQQKKIQEAKAEFLWEKRALAVAGLTEEQWKLLKPKLATVERLWNLCESEGSTSGLSLGGSSRAGTSSQRGNGPSEPRWQWKTPWRDRDPAELSDAQKMAEQLIKLLDKRNARPEEFKQKIAALRKARISEVPASQKRQAELSTAQEELRKGLTTRQEAALVLLGRL